ALQLRLQTAEVLQESIFSSVLCALCGQKYDAIKSHRVHRGRIAHKVSDGIPRNQHFLASAASVFSAFQDSHQASPQISKIAHRPPAAVFSVLRGKSNAQLQTQQVSSSRRVVVL